MIFVYAIQKIDECAIPIFHLALLFFRLHRKIRSVISLVTGYTITMHPERLNATDLIAAGTPFRIYHTFLAEPYPLHWHDFTKWRWLCAGAAPRPPTAPARRAFPAHPGRFSSSHSPAG